MGERPDEPTALADEHEPPAVDEASPPSLDADTSWSLIAPIDTAPSSMASTPAAHASPAGPGGQHLSPIAEAGPDGAAVASPSSPGPDEPSSSLVPDWEEADDAAPRVRRYRAGVETAPDDLLRVPETTAQVADEFFEDLARRAKGR